MELIGKNIEIKSIPYARAKSIALALHSHPYVVNNSINILHNETANSIILLFDVIIELPQHPIVDINEIENIAIICYESDIQFPVVYVTRNDFPLGLSHTNISEKERPVSICVTEEDFREARLRFSSIRFIEMIREWFRLTARGTLHAEDQLLEPYLHLDKFVILPINPPTKNFHLWNLVKINDLIFRITQNSDLEKNETKNRVQLAWYYNCDPCISGYIRKSAKQVEDFSSIRINGISLNMEIGKMINNFMFNACKNIQLRDSHLAFIINIPVFRDKGSVTEREDCIIISLEKSLWEIGISLKKNHPSLKKRELKERKFLPLTQDEIDVIKVEQYSVIVDISSTSAATFNDTGFTSDKMAIIGCGSLGSNLIDIFSRCGFGKWNIIDSDVIFPHNLARHVLGHDYVGHKKVSAITTFYNQLMSESICYPIDLDFTRIKHDQKILKQLENSKLILDCSTSIQVARILANDIPEITCKRASVFLSPTGDDLVFLAEDEKRCQTLDLLEMCYYKFLIDSHVMSNHLSVPQNSKIRYNRNSCREVTSRIEYANVKILASVAAKTVIRYYSQENSFASIWKIDNNVMGINHFNIPLLDWIKEAVNDWVVLLSQQMLEELSKYRMERWNQSSVETGGVLFGTYDCERKIVYVFHDEKAPIDSVEEPTSFTRGYNDLQDNEKRIGTVSGSQVVYLGEWHSHPPKCTTNMSATDKTLFNYLVSETKGFHPIIMLIIGDKVNSVYLSANNV